jgi:hypothetical protein
MPGEGTSPNCCTARTASPLDPLCVLMTRCGQVCGPTMPSGGTPAAFWTAITAAVVAAS